MNPTNASSPCINVCQLDKSGMCIGCGRLLEEIAAWSRMTPARQVEVRQQAARRLDQARATAGHEVSRGS
jgi:predicted Fe-S protein YdhL (DUF1289 family)